VVLNCQDLLLPFSDVKLWLHLFSKNRIDNQAQFRAGWRVHEVGRYLRGGTKLPRLAPSVFGCEIVASPIL
jgi:hypothetical protein